MVNESVLPLEDESGACPPIPLLYAADKICEVRSSHLDKLYCEGRDYLLADGKLVILPDGEIKTMKYGEYYFDESIPGKSFCASKGGYIWFSEGFAMHDKQLAVTYRGRVEWEAPVPQSKICRFPRTVGKLLKNEKISLLVFGDSISTGANSSGFVGTAPFADDWCNMASKGLELFYKNDNITLTNKAVGGTTSAWGKENALAAADCTPDLAIIGFGMNDGSGKVPTGDYIQNIRRIICKIAKKSPECEFLLLSTMLPNEQVKGFFGTQEDYLQELIKLEKEGTAVADVTSLHRYLLSKKRYFDMTGNNVNHPNDFLARVYAQCVLATLGCRYD